jgi:hypothetical protein
MADLPSNALSAGPEQLRRALAGAESRMAAAMEQLVGGKGFSQLLGQAAENAAALTSINAELWDLFLRNVRVAGQADINRLGRTLNGIDDKLEVLLQELESLGEHRPAGNGTVP